MIRETATREDYLEMIYVLIKEKGYATTIDIASHLHVKSPAVTRMMQRLDKDGFVTYEKYRGVNLTPKGEKVAEFIITRHRALSKFLTMLGIDRENVQKEIEVIEHIIDEETMSHIRQFLKFAEENPEWAKKYPPFKKNYEKVLESKEKKIKTSDLKKAHKMRKSPKK
jgi:Mn-dependent DtxR family transcriptional regulator